MDLNRQKKIYLYYHDNHYDIITSMSGFLSWNYYCTHCNKGYSNKGDHKCNLVCHACRKVHEETDVVVGWIGCEKCHRFFKGERCFALHEKVTAKGNSTCLAIYRCTNCEKTVNKKMDKNHKCGQINCKVCKDFYPETHKGYMIPEATNIEIEPMSIEEEFDKAKTFIFFDLECTQDDFN